MSAAPRPRALRALSVATALVVGAGAVALAVGGVAPDAPAHLRWTIAAVLALLAVYRLALGWRA